MSEFVSSSKSPCCDAEVWDLDCDVCQTSGEDENNETCQNCDGDGYIMGWCECSECGDTFDENDVIE